MALGGRGAGSAGGGADVGDRRERAYCQKSSVCDQVSSSSRTGSVRAVEGCCDQHRVLEFGVLPAAEGALGQEPLA
jgi:hypothetical protein